MNHNCGYLNTEYARNKMVDCYDMEYRDKEKSSKKDNEKEKGEKDADSNRTSK